MSDSNKKSSKKDLVSKKRNINEIDHIKKDEIIEIDAAKDEIIEIDYDTEEIIDIDYAEKDKIIDIDYSGKEGIIDITSDSIDSGSDNELSGSEGDDSIDGSGSDDSINGPSTKDTIDNVSHQARRLGNRLSGETRGALDYLGGMGSQGFKVLGLSLIILIY